MQSSTKDQTQGLSAKEVAEREAAGLTNHVKAVTSRPVWDIIRANVLTLFNAILAGCLVIVLAVGSPQDALFGFVLVINSAVGVIAEFKAKRTLDNLAILHAPHARVRRDGEIKTIDKDQVVLDDLLELRLGDQIPADCEVIESRGLEVDESLLTGESVPLKKKPGDTVLAATAVVSGSALVKATKVGEQTYSYSLTKEAKKFSLAKSELRAGIDLVLKWISYLILPVVVLLMWSQMRADGGILPALNSGSWRGAVVLAVAGVVGMIPQGLVLLTSVNFAVAAAALSRQKVLVQDLPAVEILARVDVLCSDKTGTLTSGGVKPFELLHLDSEIPQDLALSVFAALTKDGANQTAAAIAELAGQASPIKFDTEIPFNSARKWSAGICRGESWVMGAPEIVLAQLPSSDQVFSTIESHTSLGRRVICLAHSTGAITDEALPAGLRPVALAVLEEELRSDAAETVAYFQRQDVRVIVISGDNPRTVGALAQRAGLGKGGFVDARELGDDKEKISQAVASSDVFGRVTPEQKRAMVHALQAQGHTVAMTGDGVNDALALKDADLGIAMGSGAAATKAVAKLVLLDGRFATLPPVVDEGRRIIANMERVANLFLAKTTYATVLAILASIFAFRYPMLPRHMTIISSLTIGIPAFFLALAPTKQRYRPGFLRRTLTLAIPSGLVLAAAILAVYLPYRSGNAQLASTGVTLTMVVCGLWYLGVLSSPIRSWRGLLLLAMAASATLLVVVPIARRFFALTIPTGTLALHGAIVSLVTFIFLSIIGFYVKRKYWKHKEK